jgi:hypothetical protein
MPVSSSGRDESGVRIGASRSRGSKPSEPVAVFPSYSIQRVCNCVMEYRRKPNNTIGGQLLRWVGECV